LFSWFLTLLSEHVLDQKFTPQQAARVIRYGAQPLFLGDLLFGDGCTTAGSWGAAVFAGIAGAPSKARAGSATLRGRWGLGTLVECSLCIAARLGSIVFD
jgi:hypothetical protein